MRGKKIYDLEERKMLRETDIFQEYLFMLQKQRKHLIIIAVKDTPGYELTEEIDSQLKKLGISNNLAGQHWHGFVAIIKNGKVLYEKLGKVDEAVSVQMEICSKLKLSVISKPLNDGNDVEIVINGTDYAVKMRGLNIVVYDVREQYAIDSVCFDTHERSLAAYREYWSRIGKRIEILEDSVVTQEYKKRLNVQTLLPKSNQIKVRLIFWGGVYFWNTQKSIVEAFSEDKRFDVKIIIYGSYDLDNKKKILKESNYDAVYMGQYDVSKDKPDILIISPGYDWLPYEKMDLENFQEYSALIVVIPMVLIKICNQPIQEHLKKIMNDASKNMDYFLFDKLIYQEAKKDRLISERMVEIGHPKFDEIYYSMHQKKEIPNEWEKLKNKKIVLWTTTHVYESANVSIDLYIEKVLRYFEVHKDMALIFRPHPILIVELKDKGIWTEEDLHSIRQYMQSTPNVIWDDLPEYAVSYSIADAIVADANCGISVSAMVTGKPLGIFFRYDDRKCRPAHPQVMEALYCIYSVEEAWKFFDMVSKEQDPMKETRMEACHQYISHFDGQNGKRIKDFIADKYAEKFGLPLHTKGGGAVNSSM